MLASWPRGLVTGMLTSAVACGWQAGRSTKKLKNRHSFNEFTTENRLNSVSGRGTEQRRCFTTETTALNGVFVMR